MQAGECLSGVSDSSGDTVEADASISPQLGSSQDEDLLAVSRKLFAQLATPAESLLNRPPGVMTHGWPLAPISL